jgi:hypothetical protein
MKDMTMTKTDAAAQATDCKITARGVQVYYGDNHALKDVDVNILDRTVTAFLGLREINVPALSEPDERHHSDLPGGGRHSSGRRRHL